MEVALPRNINIIKSAELEDYYVFYAFNRSAHLFLYVTDKSLYLIEEVEINEPGYFSSDFHQTNKNELLFSVTKTSTSEKLPETKSSYQYFETKWYKLHIVDGGIIKKKKIVKLEAYKYWKKSEIKNIKSTSINGKIYWVSDIQNIRIENGFYKKSWSLQYAITTEFGELPTFHKIEIAYSGIKAIDFKVDNKNLIVGAICAITCDKPLVLSYNMETAAVQKEELNIKVRRLHHLHDVKLIQSETEIISYFNSTSHEYSKKYEFRIYKAKTLKSFGEASEISFLNELDYLRNVKWYEQDNKLYTSYAHLKESKAVRLSQVSINNESIISEFEDINSIMISESQELIFSIVKGGSLKKTYLSKHKIG